MGDTLTKFGTNVTKGVEDIGSKVGAIFITLLDDSLFTLKPDCVEIIYNNKKYIITGQQGTFINMSNINIEMQLTLTPIVTRDKYSKEFTKKWITYDNLSSDVIHVLYYSKGDKENSKSFYNLIKNMGSELMKIKSLTIYLIPGSDEKIEEIEEIESSPIFDYRYYEYNRKGLVQYYVENEPTQTIENTLYDIHHRRYISDGQTVAHNNKK